MILERDLRGFSPEIAVLLGLNEAIALHRIEGLIEQEELHGSPVNGYYWITKNQDEWQQEFHWWDKSTVKRTFAKLKHLGILLSLKMNTHRGIHTKSITISQESRDIILRIGKEQGFDWGNMS